MIVNTKAFGEKEIDERQKIYFPLGLFGFEDYKDYIIFDAPQKPFIWLQSLEESQIAFILIDPFIFSPKYEPKIGKNELNQIELESDKDEKSVIMSIVTIPQDGGAMTANLQGPLLINREKQIGKQCIAQDNRWTTKHDIVKEMSEKKEQSC